MKRVLGLMALGILSLGCSRASSFVHPTYDFSALEKVAVVKVTGAKGNPSAQNEVGDLFNMQLLRRGFDVIERSQIDAVLTEQEFQTSDMTDTDATEMGKVLNVDAVMIVNVAQDGEDIAMTAKMVETRTGALLWTGEGTARVGSFLATAGGALVGAVIGAVIGHQVDQGAGTVIGGVAGAALGGLAGHALSPSEANTFRKLVIKITEGMPTKVPLSDG